MHVVIVNGVFAPFLIFLQRSVMSTPVGKGGGLNVTVDIEVSLNDAFLAELNVCLLNLM